MELKNRNESIKQWLAKYKYALAVLLIGLLLMMIPTGKPEADRTEELESAEATENADLSTELSELLSGIYGAGKVKVMLTVAEGERIHYQEDMTSSQSEDNTNSKTQTILITDSDRNQTGLIQQKNPPIYRGAVVLAQEADEPTVKLAIVDAVRKVTGLGADKIAVLKMK